MGAFTDTSTAAVAAGGGPATAAAWSRCPLRARTRCAASRGRREQIRYPKSASDDTNHKLREARLARGRVASPPRRLLGASRHRCPAGFWAPRSLPGAGFRFLEKPGVHSLTILVWRSSLPERVLHW